LESLRQQRKGELIRTVQKKKKKKNTKKNQRTEGVGKRECGLNKVAAHRKKERKQPYKKI